MNDCDKVVKLKQNPIFKFHKKNKKKVYEYDFLYRFTKFNIHSLDWVIKITKISGNLAVKSERTWQESLHRSQM